MCIHHERVPQDQMQFGNFVFSLHSTFLRAMDSMNLQVQEISQGARTGAVYPVCSVTGWDDLAQHDIVTAG